MNELDRPLGYDAGGKSYQNRNTVWTAFGRMSSGHVAVFGTSFLLLTVVGYAAFFGSPDGGRARGVGRIADATQPVRTEARTISRDDVTASIPPREPSAIATAADLEKSSGVRVMRGAGGAPSSALVINVEEALGTLPPAPDPRVAERTKTGVLPKIGADGSRPSQVYAKAYRPDPAKANMPKIALMVGGLGLSAATTRDALDKLPPAVTFAFAPYGADLEADAARARAKGHETVLQLPMEPIDSARNDPGPHTLQLAAPASETDADLRWLLGRFPGYFAVSPFLGGRFLQSADALSPVLQDIAARGLALVEDGTPSRSVLDGSARDAGISTIRATIKLDGDSDPKGFETALVRLEAAARKDGFAFGTASALPGSIDRLAKFISTLESRGIVLVPVSASPPAAGPMAQGADRSR